MSLTVNLRLTPQRTLAVLLGLRGVAVVAQVVVLALAVNVFRLSLPMDRLLPATALLSLAALATGWRLLRRWPVTELEISLHLLLDTAVLTWLFYFAGGSANPFVFAYLVPIALAAVALRPHYGAVVTVVCIIAYTLLLQYHVPLPEGRPGADGGFAMHVFGMWVNFLLSACLIAGLLWVMAESLRRRDRVIAEARENMLRNEHVVALGTLAASAAHELSTPLSTAALVADELAMELGDNAGAQRDLALLQQQIQACKASLSTLLASAGQGRLEDSTPIGVDRFLTQILERWRTLRPDITLTATLTGAAGVDLHPAAAVAQALTNLLDNAADASTAAGSDQVTLIARLHEGHLVIEIRDEGAGMSETVRSLAGRVAFTTKRDGSGLGLLLSNTSLERWGGTLSLYERSSGGTFTRVTLPLSRLEVGA